jgi:hypothetical protein
LYVATLSTTCEEEECELECTDLAECIEYIREQLILTGGGGGVIDPDSDELMAARFPSELRGEEIAELAEGCDLDALWAGIREVVRRLDSVGRDVLDEVVAEADLIDRVSRVVALVPIIGDVAGEIVLALAEESENLSNMFEAYSSESTIDDVACHFFSLTCELCRYPTFNELMDYFWGQGVENEDDWRDIFYTAAIDYLIGTTELAERVVWFTTISVALLTMYLGESFGAAHGRDYLALWAAVGEDAPTDAWELICGPCGGEDELIDFTASDQGWSFWSEHGGTHGTWSSSTGLTASWCYHDQWGYANRLSVYKDFTDKIVRGIRYTYTSSITLNFLTLACVVNSVAHETTIESGEHSVEFVINDGDLAELSQIWFQWYPGTSDAPEGTVFGILSVELLVEG